MDDNTQNLPPPQDDPSDSAAQTIRKLSDTIGNSQEVLFWATTIFPFTLFPDTATLDREKLTITHRFFFGVSEITTIRVEDVLSVTEDLGPFFGSLQVHSRFFNPNQPQTVNYLRRRDAAHLKRILQGYISPYKEG